MGSVMLDKTGSFDSQQPAESIPEDIFLPSNCDGQRSVPNRGMHGLNRVKSAMNAAKVQILPAHAIEFKRSRQSPRGCLDQNWVECSITQQWAQNVI